MSERKLARLPLLSGGKDGAGVCSAWRLAWSWQMARQNLSQAWTACLAILEEKQEVATQQKKARRSCFHLLHQEFFLLGLDPTKASVT